MNSKKPTRYQRKLLEDNGLDARKWYIQKDTPVEMQVVNIDNQKVKILPKR